MKFRFRLINWNLALTLALALGAAGCASSSKKDKQISTIRLHFEVNPQMVRRSIEVSVLRAHPLRLTVAEQPLVHEGYLNAAEIISSGGTPSIKLTFNPAGKRLLETETAVSLGKHIAIFAQFPEPRWLAAPVVTGRNTDGTITFTPDASLEECRRLIDGLNLVIAERKKDKFTE
jgi:hypothetical protein